MNTNSSAGEPALETAGRRSAKEGLLDLVGKAVIRGDLRRNGARRALWRHEIAGAALSLLAAAVIGMASKAPLVALYLRRDDRRWSRRLGRS